MVFCEVAVDYPRDDLLTYKIEEAQFTKGKLVNVPLGRRKARACLLRIVDESTITFDTEKIKEVDLEEEHNFVLPDDYIDLYSWMSRYYHYPLGKLIFDCLPKFLKRPRKLNFTDGEGEEIDFQDKGQRLEIVNAISRSKLYEDFFIHGVTGSGKSFLYIKIIQQKLTEGKSVLFLIPEINLSPQFISFFKKFINASIYTYNSQVSASQKFGLFKECLESKRPIVIIGVRSSLFLPIKNLGLIVIDEFHDQSFKQEDRCSYNARDTAIKLAKLKDIPIVMGSATPNMETYYHYKKSRKTNYFELKERFGNTVLPDIEITSSKEEKQDEEIWPFLSTTLEGVEETLNKNKKVIIYANKLGFSSYIECRSCKHVFECPNCSVSLKYYKRKNELSCHYCGLSQKKNDYCPECNSLTFYQRGYGTEKIKEILEERFPTAVIKRFDRDVLKNHKDLEKILSEVEEGKIDILVGTQMISKGHNFKDVERVIVLGSDQALNIPDFRSNEKLYHSLTQISGRAGRFGEKGKVVIQTSYPENKIFKQIQDDSINNFYENELEMRQEFKMPPFSKMAMVYITGPKSNEIESFSKKIYFFMKELEKKNFQGVEVLPPRSALIEKLVNKFTWCILLKSQNVQNLHNLLTTTKNNIKIPSRTSFKIDIDPYNFY